MMSLINNTGEWRMGLRNDWDSVVGVIRYPRESENGEWRTGAQQLSFPHLVISFPDFYRHPMNILLLMVERSLLSQHKSKS